MTAKLDVYEQQRGNARRRRIPWTLTYEQWDQVWQASGQWNHRGRAPMGSVLCRIDPLRGFEWGNVHIQTGRAAAELYWQGPARPQALAHNRELANLHCRPIRTPQGDFPSGRAAAAALGITPSCLNWRRVNWPDRYYHI